METTNQNQPEEVASYGLLAINHAYNQGKISFKKWLEMSGQWALQYKAEQKGGKKKNK